MQSLGWALRVIQRLPRKSLMYVGLRLHPWETINATQQRLRCGPYRIEGRVLLKPPKSLLQIVNADTPLPWLDGAQSPMVREIDCLYAIRQTTVLLEPRSTTQNGTLGKATRVKFPCISANIAPRLFCFRRSHIQSLEQLSYGR